MAVDPTPLNGQEKNRIFERDQIMAHFSMKRSTHCQASPKFCISRVIILHS